MFFLLIDSGVMLIGDVTMTERDASRNEGVSGFKVVCGKLRY